MEELRVKLITPEKKETEISLLPSLNEKEFPLEVFDKQTIAFSDALSKSILQNKDFNRIPALTALAFWLRKSNIEKIIKENEGLFSAPNTKILPLGKVLHICPSNVDTIFVYSLMISLLAGNKNILRVSSKTQPAFLDFLFESINSLCKQGEFSIFGNYINIVSYPHNAEISTYLSKSVDGRIIWGGDNTAALFKSITTNPRCRDIVFADRISFSVIKCSTFLSATPEIQNETARKFYNDSYTFDQKGCSSPQQVFFAGTKDEYEKTVSEFFNRVDEIAKAQYDYDEASLGTMKFNELVNETIEKGTKKILHQTAYTYTIEATESQLKHTCGGGYFYSVNIHDLNEISAFLNTKIQTLSYFGLNEDDLRSLVPLAKGRGGDRIVPIGRALDFDYVWDGYNLVNALTRTIHIS
ncbi:MAG: acyl-CoA reductase [Bacteroidia bacterium]